MAHEAATAKAKEGAKKKLVQMKAAFAHEAELQARIDATILAARDASSPPTPSSSHPPSSHTPSAPSASGGRGGGGEHGVQVVQVVPTQLVEEEDAGESGGRGSGNGGGKGGNGNGGGEEDGNSLAEKRRGISLRVETDGGSGVYGAASPTRGESPLHTPNLAISRKESMVSGGDDFVSWRGSLSIVLDLDETLVAAQEGHPDMPVERLDVHNVYLRGQESDPMLIAIRPWATRFLWYLNEEGFEVYVLTAGSQPYCDAIVELFNTLARESTGKPTILAGKSCRDSYGHVRLKEFEHVLPSNVLPEYAIGVDNKRSAWHPRYQSQVIVTPDYLPSWTKGQAETILMQILDKALHITYFFERYYNATGQFQHTGTILSQMYERQIKASMVDIATDFQFTHPDAVGEDGSFLAYLTERES